MKKALIVAALASAATLSYAASKTVTLDFSDPTVYGYAKPETSAGTNLEVGESVTNEEVSITVVTNGTTSTRFYNSGGTIALRMTSGCSVSVSASGHTITGIEMTGVNLTASNLGVSTGSLSGSGSAQVWSGSTETLTLTRNNGSLQFFTMAVTFEADGGNNGSGESTGFESYDAIENGVIASVFENAVADGGRSIVSFGTNNMDVEAVGGRTPKDVKLAKTETFTDWVEWNEPEWKGGNTNLHDNKPGVDTVLFHYIQGSGNPAVEIGVDEPTEKDDSLVYKAKYTYYSPDGSLGMPVMGLYYKFTPKVNGSVKVRIWANKGNRYTYVVKESAKTPITYTKEGYVNGQNRTVENVTMKSLVNGADSIGSMNEKIFLNNAQIDSIHEAVLWKYTITSNGVTTKELNATQLADSIATGAYPDAKVDTIKSHGVNDPYIIAGGNQAFWGWITFDVEAGESYWLFQHSSQVGFGGYEFTFDNAAGIEDLASDKKPSSKAIFDLTGRRASALQSGKAYIVGGKAVIIR
ncbi:MAG: hypothetical protein E7070_08690 [Bacteroidales bacterium]|jgi:hypothetical protein|nr:hypothetical protein [Bacteroidales bacterium]